MPKRTSKNSPSDEKTIQSAILKFLNSLHPEVYAVKVILANKRGVPDILCCYKGKFIAIEVKRPESKTPNYQLFQGQLIKDAGGVWYVVNGVDDVIAILTLL